MQARRVKSAADERDVGERIQVAEHTEPIDDDHVGVGRVWFVDASGGEPRSLRPLDETRGPIGRRLVRGDDQSRRTGRARNGLERGQQHGLVGRPRRAGDDRWPRIAQPLEHGSRPIDALRAKPHLIVSRVAGDDDDVGAHAERDESIGVGVIDGAHGFERGVRVAEQCARRARPARRAAGERGADQSETHTARALASRVSAGHTSSLENTSAVGASESIATRASPGVSKGRKSRKSTSSVRAKRDRARRKVGIRELRVGASRARQLEDRARLQAFAHGRRVHPQQRSGAIALRRSPRSVARANSATCAQRAQQLRVAVWRDDSRAPRELGQCAIPELHRKAHCVHNYGFAGAGLSASSIAAATLASAEVSVCLPTKKVGVEFTPTCRARS